MKETNKSYEKMNHKEIVFDDGYIYLKWEDKGIWVSVEIDEETKIAEVDAIDSWYYPKKNKISKDTTKEIKGMISSYFSELGYTTKYTSYD